MTSCFAPAPENGFWTGPESSRISRIKHSFLCRVRGHDCHRRVFGILPACYVVMPKQAGRNAAPWPPDLAHAAELILLGSLALAFHQSCRLAQGEIARRQDVGPP